MTTSHLFQYWHSINTTHSEFNITELWVHRADKRGSEDLGYESKLESFTTGMRHDVSLYLIIESRWNCCGLIMVNGRQCDWSQLVHYRCSQLMWWWFSPTKLYSPTSPIPPSSLRLHRLKGRQARHWFTGASFNQFWNSTFCAGEM